MRICLFLYLSTHQLMPEALLKRCLTPKNRTGQHQRAQKMVLNSCANHIWKNHDPSGACQILANSTVIFSSFAWSILITLTSTKGERKRMFTVPSSQRTMIPREKLTSAAKNTTAIFRNAMPWNAWHGWHSASLSLRSLGGKLGLGRTCKKWWVEKIHF